MQTKTLLASLGALCVLITSSYGLPSGGCRACQATVGDIKGKVTRHVGQHSMEWLLDVMMMGRVDQPVSELASEEQYSLSSCGMCRTVMTIVHHYQEDTNHRNDILNELEAGCHLLPEFSTSLCSALMGHNGKPVMQFLHRYLNPKLCIAFHLCPKDAAGLLE